MKILLLYTARSGSTSILNYFSKVKPEYTCYNEPWYTFMIQQLYNGNRIDYNELIKEDNIFVKTTYRNLPVALEQLIDDFDKVIFLLRRDMVEQVESSILAFKEDNYSNRTKRNYAVYTITDDEFIDMTETYTLLSEQMISDSMKYSKPLFYYEDLFNGDFTPLFNELGIEYNSKYFDEFLDISNRYRIGVIETKNVNTLI